VEVLSDIAANLRGGPGADVGDLEPVEVPEGGVGAADGVLDGVLDALRRRARELGDLVDLVTHTANRTGPA
jgi:hypothetical protein